MNKLTQITVTSMLFITTNLYASNYPEKPIEMIIPYSAGSNSDSAARILISTMRSYLDTELIPINSAGAGGTIGLNKLSRSKADGYTIGFSPTGPVAIQPQIRNVPYDMSSFKTICLVVNNPVTISVSPNSEINTFNDLINEAKNKKLVAVGGAPGSIPHVVQSYIANKYDTKFIYLPAGGGAKASKAILGGEADFVADSSSIGNLYGLKTILTLGDERLPDYSNAPTLKELGTDFTLSVWFGLFAPKNLPEDRTKRLSHACEEAVNNTDFKSNMKRAGFIVSYKNSSDFRSFYEKEYVKYESILKEINIIK